MVGMLVAFALTGRRGTVVRVDERGWWVQWDNDDEFVYCMRPADVVPWP